MMLWVNHMSLHAMREPVSSYSPEHEDSLKVKSHASDDMQAAVDIKPNPTGHLAKDLSQVSASSNPLLLPMFDLSPCLLKE